jgi:peptidyl-prolyl cis-trans isomerase A (cyclophilin A)
MCTRVRVQKGELIRLTTASGGGYGDPAARARADIVKDLKNGFITPEHPAKIEVIQMGWRETNPGIPPSRRHETTAMTGLRHRKGTVSLARFAPGAVYHSWFVCMRDEPGLDAGGLRHPDGQGFAAFTTLKAAADTVAPAPRPTAGLNVVCGPAA